MTTNSNEGQILPPSLPNSRMRSRSEVGEAANENFDKHFLSNLKKNNWSHVRLRSGQRSKSSLFTLSATETGLITAVNTTSTKRLPKG